MLITLTTDFGLDDPFVAIMKGVILGRCPDVQLVDICHTIAPQDIAAASLQLSDAAPYFPADTLHVAVVDPGVGTSRRIICLKTNNQLFLAPDNGLLTPFLDNAEAIFQVNNDLLFLQPVSDTFHGRDIFAPVAAALACGLNLHELGPELQLKDLIRFELPKPGLEQGCLQGQCLRADRFGNMTTNISKQDLDSFLGNSNEPVITLASTTITGLNHSYESGKDGAIALINSSNKLEISIPGGNAAHDLNLFPSTAVRISKKPIF